MFKIFKRKREIEKLKQEIQESFNHVKKDFIKVGHWIRHIDDKDKKQDSELRAINEELRRLNNKIDYIQEEIMEIKDYISFFGPKQNRQQIKQEQTSVDKQTRHMVVQTAVQTAVQTPQTDVLDNLTVMERAIVWALINADMKLSYEDLAALLGKDKSTIRGQINTIRQKREGIIEEMIELNGKKRLYVPEEIKKNIIKSLKVKVKSEKNQKSES